MQDKRTGSIEPAQARRVDAGILALLLSKDWYWRISELQRALHASVPNVPLPLVTVSVERLHADGLLNLTRPNPRTANDEQLIRASWAAVRADDLARHGLNDSLKRACKTTIPR